MELVSENERQPWEPMVVRVSPAVPARVVVMTSGAGTTLQMLFDAAVEDYPARVVAVGTDRPCPALYMARRLGLPGFTAEPVDYASRRDWDAALTDATMAHRPDFVVCGGFMRILGPQFLSRLEGRVLNTHPSLLPSFPGGHGIRDALDYGVKVTGYTVHLVDAGVDTGPILAQQAVEIYDDDDERSLDARIRTVESSLLVDVLARIARHGLEVSERHVSIP